jgi:dipeptidyl aminopeptidase/acylaminoacyl peptidase
MPKWMPSWVRLLALGLAGAVGAPALAQAPEAPLPLEAFFAPPDMSQVHLSPSGRYLAVLIPGAGERNVLAVVDLDDSGKSRALVRYEDADVDGVTWVDDDWLVYRLGDSQAGSGQHDFAPGLFSISRSGGKPRGLVKVRGNPFFTDGAAGLDRRLDYNHRLLAVPQDGSREVIVGEITFSREGHVSALRPLRLNVETGRTRHIEHLAPGSTTLWMFDAAGEPRLAAQYTEGRLTVRWRAPGSTDWASLLDADWLRPPWAPHSLGGGGALYVTHVQGAGGTQVLARYDFDKRAPAAEPTVVVPGFDFSGTLVHEAKTGRTLGVRAQTDGETTVWLDATLKTLQDEVDRRLPGRVNRIDCRRCDAEDRSVLIESWSDGDPGTFLVWRGRQGELQRVGRRMKGIDSRRMARLDFHRYAARDGRQIPLWITEPRRAEGSAPPPAVVLVHGGPFLRGGSWRWRALPQFLASRGYVVIEPEFRGSTGYGSEHFRAGWKQWGQAMQDDVADAVRWAVAGKRIDGKRVCIAGGSYGGYATLMGLVRDPELYRCGAAWAAVSEPMRMLQGSWWWADDISDEARRYSLPVMLGDPKTDAEMLKAISPLQQAARIKAPVLLVHGEADRRVPFVHAKEMREALRRNGQEPEWLTFPEEAHSWRKLDNQRAFARRLESFLAQHLK